MLTEQDAEKVSTLSRLVLCSLKYITHLWNELFQHSPIGSEPVQRKAKEKPTAQRGEMTTKGMRITWCGSTAFKEDHMVWEHCL